MPKRTGVDGAKVVLEVQVGSIVTSTEKVENVVVEIPASLGRGSLHRSEVGWIYVTQCEWREQSDGTWAIDPASPARTCSRMAASDAIG